MGAGRRATSGSQQGFAGSQGGHLSDIVQIKHWRTSAATAALYEKLLGAIGTEDFGATVRDSVMSLTAGARRIYLFEATSREDSSLQYFFGEPGLVELFPAYRKWYLPLDPVCDAYRAAPTCTDVAMLRIRPCDIDSPGFRRRIFDTPGIIERVSVIQRGADAWRVMNVARHASDGKFSDDEMDSLIGLACLVLPMLPLNRERRLAPLPLSVPQIEQRFAKQYDCLTARERQVCARAAIGMSVEATALDLGIAKTSVLTYRQRAYQRLGVTSPIELCALVTH
jgi:DNA-binding CsgD family transcriptional regulator